MFLVFLHFCRKGDGSRHYVASFMTESHKLVLLICVAIFVWYSEKKVMLTMKGMKY